MRMTALGWSILRVAVASYVGLALLLYLRQAKYLYFPSRELGITPETARLAYEDVVVRTADGETVHGWFVPAPDSRGTVLFCHGNAGNIANRLDAIWRFHELGLDVCIFDYRGYGRSTGKPSEAGTYRDAEAMWTWLTATKTIAPGRVVVFGESLGGAVAAWVAEQKQPGAAILESTFTSVPDMAARMYPFLPIRWLCRFRYATLERMPRIRCPVLVAHSPDDEMIPFSQGRKLFEAAREPKVFLTLKGSHNSGREETGRPYDQAIDAFITRFLGGGVTTQ
jgi:fermentation-respiration switch protein FrsA (DUF1100 family)